MVEKKFQNKIVVVTGASSGVGKTIANFFLNKNAKVFICARRLNLMKKNFKNKKNVFIFKSDLSKESDRKKFIKYIIKKFNKIDILINNAGFAYYSPVTKINYKNLKKTFEINFFAPLMIIKAIIPEMKKKNYGRIINISSGGSVNCVKNYLAYSASKAALNTLTKTAAKELKNYNIKVNSLSPGPCKTKMFPKNLLNPSLCLPTVEYLSSLGKNGFSGKYFSSMREIKIFPDLTSKKVSVKI